MKVKITDVARGELEALDGDSRARVLAALRSIPSSVETDRAVHLSGVSGDVRIHRLSSRLRALYRINDVDGDGEDDVVVLQIVDRRVAEPIVSVWPDDEGASKPLRLGRELASEVLASD